MKVLEKQYLTSQNVNQTHNDQIENNMITSKKEMNDLDVKLTDENSSLINQLNKNESN